MDIENDDGGNVEHVMLRWWCMGWDGLGGAVKLCRLFVVVVDGHSCGD